MLSLTMIGTYESEQAKLARSTRGKAQDRQSGRKQNYNPHDKNIKKGKKLGSRVPKSN